MTDHSCPVLPLPAGLGTRGVEPGGKRGRATGRLLPEGPRGVRHGAHRRRRHGLPVGKCQQAPGPQSGELPALYLPLSPSGDAGGTVVPHDLSSSFMKFTVRQRGERNVTRQNGQRCDGTA